MDKSPHQLVKNMSTSSEEFRKFVNQLLYEDTSKFKISSNHTEIKRPLRKTSSINFATLTESNLRATLNIKQIQTPH